MEGRGKQEEVVGSGMREKRRRRHCFHAGYTVQSASLSGRECVLPAVNMWKCRSVKKNDEGKQQMYF